MKVLLVEDDKRIANLVAQGLREGGHDVTNSYDGVEGTLLLLNSRYDVVLLDINLPGVSGMQILETVRSRQSVVPILMLTAVDSVPDVLKAFNLGADDYIVKPFLLQILLARVEAIARRTQTVQNTILRIAGITLNPELRVAWRDGREIQLTQKQAKLLKALMRRSGHLTSREELIDAAWEKGADVKGNTLDVYMHGLRAKLGDGAEATPLIRTVHGMGYIFSSE
ncbi:response regulator transcription factor [Silvibacterium acidisoli]|uniref:response regulator transcription factor n=1 Tax=Acidobacteriaceae bacterium ZG23-2 TaxID=2883246 RepID=UPI00406CB5A2